MPYSKLYIPRYTGERKLSNEFRAIDKEFLRLSQAMQTVPPYDAPWVDVKTFGARGDWSHDDTASIQLGVDDPTGWLYFSPGTYKFSGNIGIPSNRTIVFHPEAVLKLADGAGGGVGVGKAGLSNADWTNGNNNISIYGLNGDGNKAGNGSKNLHFLYFCGVVRLNIFDAYIKNVPDDGNMTAGGDGCYLHRAGTTPTHHNKHVRMGHNWFEGCMRNGLSIIDAYYSSFIANGAIGCGNNGLDVEPNDNVNDRLVQDIIDFFYVVNSTYSGIVVKFPTAGPPYFQYSGLGFNHLMSEGSGRHGIHVQDVSYLKFADIQMKNNSLEADNTYSGIYLYNCLRTGWTGIRCYGATSPPSQKYGFEEAGSSDYNRVFDAELSGNYVESVLVGAHSGIVNPPITSGVSDHGLLTGLGDDDHTQYMLVDGTRSIKVGVTPPGSPAAGDLWVDTT